jgi:hypothetical protein
VARSAARASAAAESQPTRSPGLVISTVLAPVVVLPTLLRGIVRAMAMVLLLLAVIVYGVAWSCWTLTTRLARRSQALPHRPEDGWPRHGTRPLRAWSAGRRGQ